MLLLQCCSASRYLCKSLHRMELSHQEVHTTKHGLMRIFKDESLANLRCLKGSFSSWSLFHPCFCKVLGVSEESKASKGCTARSAHRDGPDSFGPEVKHGRNHQEPLVSSCHRIGEQTWDQQTAPCRSGWRIPQTASATQKGAGIVLVRA